MTIWDLGEVYDGRLMPAVDPRLKMREIRLVLVNMEL